MPQRSVVVAGDHPEIASLLQLCLELEGFTVFPAHDGQGVLSAVEGDEVDAVVFDIWITGELDGFDVPTQLRRPGSARPDVPIVMCSALNYREWEPKALAAGPSAFVRKPFTPADLASEVMRRASTR